MIKELGEYLIPQRNIVYPLFSGTFSIVCCKRLCISIVLFFLLICTVYRLTTRSVRRPVPPFFLPVPFPVESYFIVQSWKYTCHIFYYLELSAVGFPLT